jgi:hypothetical protein
MKTIPENVLKAYTEGNLTSLWMYQETLNEQRTMFVNDCYESLSSFWGIANNNKPVLKHLKSIFDNTIKNLHGHSIVISNTQLNSLVNQFNAKDYHNDEGDEMIINIIESIWKGE